MQNSSDLPAGAGAGAGAGVFLPVMVLLQLRDCTLGVVAAGTAECGISHEIDYKSVPSTARQMDQWREQGYRGRGLGMGPLGGGLTSDTSGRGSHRCRLTSDLL
jgi:hypothetical protein